MSVLEIAWRTGAEEPLLTSPAEGRETASRMNGLGWLPEKANDDVPASGRKISGDDDGGGDGDDGDEPQMKNHQPHPMARMLSCSSMSRRDLARSYPCGVSRR